MKKINFSTELAYILGLTLIALGVVFMEKANFGVSMVVAPAYILFKFLNTFLPFFTFGMAEYVLQAFLIILLIVILRKFKIAYVLSFATAILYGLILDGLMLLGNFLPTTHFALRILYYILGMVITASGVALQFKTYLPQESYELFVKEISSCKNINIHKFKTCYDLSSLLVGIILSFTFFGFGNFVGVKLGTIICALINGFIISLFTKLYDKLFTFKDYFRKSTIKE